MVYEGQVPTVMADLDNPHLAKLLGWADEVRTLGIRANADYPQDAERARKYGAEGIGLCRTEHMFFEAERLPALVGRGISNIATDEHIEVTVSEGVVTIFTYAPEPAR